MQDSPDKEELLDAIARFLERDVRGALLSNASSRDRDAPAKSAQALAFRVLIAANLARIAAAEIRAEDEQDLAQLDRLRALLPSIAIDDVDLARRAGRREATLRLERALCDRLRAGSLEVDFRARAFVHLRETLREKLAIGNPRFDLRDEIE